MNITSHTASLPLATVVNPPTDNLRRENTSRELITPPSALAQSAAEKGVASDKERARTPAQQNEQVDFTSLRKQAEQNDKTIGDTDQNSGQGGQEDKPQQQHSHQAQNQEQSKEPEQPDGQEPRSPAEVQLIKELSARDAEVKRHESAHAAVGGVATGAPNYQYQQGPDGKRYAVGGEVSVDLSAVSGDPTATIAKMQRVQAAALAPINPSIQDTKVAASAAKMILAAQTELLALEKERQQLSSGDKQHLAIDESVESTSSASEASDDFDAMMHATLEAQDNIAPQRSGDVLARAGRIEHFYSEINQAYEKPSSNNFQLTA